MALRDRRDSTPLGAIAGNLNAPDARVNPSAPGARDEAGHEEVRVDNG